MAVRNPLVIGANGKPQQIQTSDTLRLLDSVLVLQNTADPTRQVQFQLNTITTGTTVTLAVPSASGTIVLNGIAATLTNKTIPFASNTFTGTLPAAQVGTFTGDVTSAGSTYALTISTNAVDNTKLATVTTDTIKGRITAGIGNVEDLTMAQVTSMLDTFTNITQGLVPASGGGTTKFLRADGTWVVPSSGSPGGNAVSVAVDFGSSFTDKASTVVVGQSWVTSSSVIVATVPSPPGVDPDELYLLNIRPVISDLIDGVGFTVTLYSEAEAKGIYNVNCMGV